MRVPEVGQRILVARALGWLATRMVNRGFRCGRVAAPRERGFAVAERALGVRTIERQAGEELGRHAAAAAGVEEPTAGARAAGLRIAQLQEQLRVSPYARENAGLADVAGEESLVNRERAGVHVADGI